MKLIFVVIQKNRDVNFIINNTNKYKNVFDNAKVRSRGKTWGVSKLLQLKKYNAHKKVRMYLCELINNESLEWKTQ